MRLYHAAKSIYPFVDVSFSKENNDFGTGLYCTNSLEDANEYMRTRAMNVLTFEIPDNLLMANAQHSFLSIYHFGFHGVDLYNNIEYLTYKQIINFMKTVVANRKYKKRMGRNLC